MSTRSEKLLNGDIRKLLFSLSLPAIAAQIVNLLYNIVDRMYIARIEDIGTQALTGVGVAFPILILVSAFAALIGMGGAPLASIKLGEKDHVGAEKILGNCFIMLVIVSVLLTVLFSIFKEPILYAFGASEETIRYASEYIGIYLIGTIFVQIALGLNNFINAQGFAKIGMQTVLIGAIANIIFDPILIFFFGLGVRGAALATVLSQAISALWVLSFLIGKKGTLRIRKENLSLDLKIVSRVIALGLSPFIMQATECLVTIVFNVQLLSLGGNLYVGAMVILSSIMQFVILPMLGLTQGAQPIIGYNYGAKQYDRVKKTILIEVKIALLYTVVMWAVCVFTPQVFAMIFTSDVDLRSVTENAMKIYFFGTFIFGAQIVCQNAFIALGQAKVSMFLALLRKIVFLIPLIYIIPSLTTLGVNGVFLAQPIADILAASCTTISFLIISRKLLNNNPEQIEQNE